MKSVMFLLSSSMMLLIFGCSNKAKQAVSVADSPREMGQTSVTRVDPAVERAVEESGGGLVLSEEIRKLCPGVSSPRFGYDSAELRQEWSKTLRQVADCMKNGGLAGRAIVLTGHTDPRGDEDYNLSLGGRRAAAVKDVFTAFGVEGTRVKTTSRGKADARGTDEDSWAEDRRVDIDLDTSRDARTSGL